LPRFENIDINVETSLDDDIIDAICVCTSKRKCLLQPAASAQGKIFKNISSGANYYKSRKLQLRATAAAAAAVSAVGKREARAALVTKCRDATGL
jgi:hypothetical protein